MSEITPDAARRAIVEHTRRLADAAVAAGPEAAVPTAPEWTVADLVTHIGQTQHWVAEIIERRVPDPTQLPAEMAVVPTDPGEWVAWLTAAAERAAIAFSDEALDDPQIWNAAADERTGARFWMASVLNESVVHGADAAIAAGRSTEVDASIAAGLVANHLRMLASPTWATQRPESAQAIRGAGETLRWQATDASSWLVERGPDGATWRPVAGDAGEADVAVSGPAGSLLLVLTRRIPLTDPSITIAGDRALADHWIESTAHDAG